MEKVNPIKLSIEYDDGETKEYTLEFNRKTVERAERAGFDMDDLSKNMMVRVPQLFYHAFQMHHPNLTKKQTDKILFDDLGGISEEMLTRLGELFAQGYNSLINYDESKNSKVTVTM